MECRLIHMRPNNAHSFQHPKSLDFRIASLNPKSLTSSPLVIHHQDREQRNQMMGKTLHWKDRSFASLESWPEFDIQESTWLK